MLLKEQVLYQMVFLVLFREQFFTPPHSLASPDEVNAPGIVSRKSELSFQVKVSSSEIISSFKVVDIILEQ